MAFTFGSVVRFIIPRTYRQKIKVKVFHQTIHVVHILCFSIGRRR